MTLLKRLLSTVLLPRRSVAQVAVAASRSIVKTGKNRTLRRLSRMPKALKSVNSGSRLRASKLKPNKILSQAADLRCFGSRKEIFESKQSEEFQAMRKRLSGGLPLVALTLALFVIMPMTQARGQNEIKEKIKEVTKDKEYKEFKEVAKNKEFCSQNNWNNGDKVSFNELREINLPASGKIDVDGARNGGISVRGENS